jgi:hypothetical protein
MFSVDSARASMDWLDSNHVTCVSVGPYPCRLYISDKNFSAQYKRPEHSGKLEQYSKQAVNLRSTEEYTKSAYEDLTFDLKTLCVQ